MRVLFDLGNAYEERDGIAFDVWGELTGDKASFPEWLQRDSDCPPSIGDKVFLYVTHGNNIINISGKVSQRFYIDTNGNANIPSPGPRYEICLSDINIYNHDVVEIETK